MIDDGSYSVSAKWQTALGVASSIGIIVGIYINGFVVDRWGARWTMIVSLVLLSGFLGLSFAATSPGMLLAGQLLCGLPWGTLNVIAPAYAVEVLPLALRHYGPTYVNMCWVIGHLIGAGVLTGLVDNTTQWGWRIPIALNWMWPPFLIIAAYYCPESPWWLVRKDRDADALKSLQRLSTSDVNHEEACALIRHTVNLEKSLDFGTSYADCFKGIDRRRTEISLMAWCSQAFVGFIIQGYQTYLFRQAGMAQTDAFKLTLGTFGVAGLGTMISMPLQQKFPRYTIWMAGLFWMFPTMLMVGILACIKQTKTVQWAQGSVLILWFFGYGWSCGPLAFVIASEVPSVQVRQKTIGIARGMQYVITILNTVVSPYVLNPTEANLKGKAAFIPSAFILMIMAWSYYRLPETGGKTFEDLDILFAQHVHARKFKDHIIDNEEQFAEIGKN